MRRAQQAKRRLPGGSGQRVAALRLPAFTLPGKSREVPSTKPVQHFWQFGKMADDRVGAEVCCRGARIAVGA